MICPRCAAQSSILFEQANVTEGARTYPLIIEISCCSAQPLETNWEEASRPTAFWMLHFECGDSLKKVRTALSYHRPWKSGLKRCSASDDHCLVCSRWTIYSIVGYWCGNSHVLKQRERRLQSPLHSPTDLAPSELWSWWLLPTHDDLRIDRQSSVRRAGKKHVYFRGRTSGTCLLN